MINQKLDQLLYTVDVLLTGQQVLVTRVAQIEERLTSKETTINSLITVESNKNVGMDISKHLYDIAKKVERRQKAKVVSQEEFIKRLQELDWNKIDEDVMSPNEEKEKSNLVIEKLNRIIDLLELVTEQNNQILTNTSTSRKELRHEDIICFEVSKALYKKNVDTGKYIKVAFITGDGNISFLAKNEEVINNPSYYESTWFYLNEVGNLRYSPFDMVKVNQIYVESSISNEKYYVTGYIDDKGKAIYYDQFI